MSKRGNLYFYDAGGKFSSAKHSLTNLIDNYDICVYSITEYGDMSPKWLIIKVMLAGCMDAYLNNSSDVSLQYAVMQKMSYESLHPKNLFRRVCDFTRLLDVKIEKNIPAYFSLRTGLLSEPLSPIDFFSLEVDPNSRETGAMIYLQDKAFFMK